MRIIKKQSKTTYKLKSGKEGHYYNYFLEADNGKRIQIKCSFIGDISRLDMISEYER